jgi:translation initiation factor 2B subunit (eIF-2B alpha/beta/delta family)
VPRVTSLHPRRCASCHKSLQLLQHCASGSCVSLTRSLLLPQALQDASEQLPHLGLLNLKYDAMPADYVTMVVTEFGMIPPTSVPVILREYRQES